MSAPPSTCCGTSVSSCERSPAWSWAWNAFRPVGLIRSPITQNGWSGPMTTVLDRDWTTVSTHLPFFSCRYSEPRAESGDAGLAAEADQVQPGNAREGARVLGELTGELEALGLRVGSALATFDRLHRHRDPGNLLVDEAQRADRKSTRLNSSHVAISYAVFCLKKKKL